MWHLLKYTIYPILLMCISVIHIFFITLWKVITLFWLTFIASCITAFCIIVFVCRMTFNYLIMFQKPDGHILEWNIFKDGMTYKPNGSNGLGPDGTINESFAFSPHFLFRSFICLKFYKNSVMHWVEHLKTV